MAPTGNLQYVPGRLNEQELKVIIYLLKNSKAAQIMVALCDKKSSYLNEIQSIVGGSKTSTIEVLKALEELKIITSQWQIEEIKGKGGPKSRAIKSFKLSEDKEKLIEFYEPFFRKIE